MYDGEFIEVLILLFCVPASSMKQIWQKKKKTKQQKE